MARARVAGVAVPVRAVVTVVLLLAAVAAVISSTRGVHVNPARAATAASLVAPATARTPAVAAVYRYPLGCLGESLSTGAAASRGADRAGPCWRYGVFLTAVLREVRGVWRLGLEAVSRTCPSVALPGALRTELLACRR